MFDCSIYLILVIWFNEKNVISEVYIILVVLMVLLIVEVGVVRMVIK